VTQITDTGGTSTHVEPPTAEARKTEKEHPTPVATAFSSFLDRGQMANGMGSGDLSSLAFQAKRMGVGNGHELEWHEL
jgi:hypothetical protein